MKFLLLLTCTVALNANPFSEVVQSKSAILIKTVKKALLYGRIIGGSNANPLQFPFAAAIYAQTSNSKHFCSGTLLSNQWILTAGQCVDGVVLFQILLGLVHLETDDPGRLDLATSNYVLHPDYNPSTLENDIGLIHLRIPVTLTDYIQPVEGLPMFEVPDFVTASIFGWGQTSDADAGLASQLQWVTVVTMTNEECKLTYGNQITDNMVCVRGNYNEGTCYGDVGSAMVQYYSTGRAYPVGISSFVSYNGCESFDPSGFTRVYPYNSWIRNVTELNI